MQLSSAIDDFHFFYDKPIDMHIHVYKPRYANISTYDKKSFINKSCFYSGDRYGGIFLPSLVR